MRPTFLARLVNGPLFDPVVFVHILNLKSALLFDCGRVDGLSNREILSLDSIFISHLHMDHFMGFDRILRVILHRQRPLNLYGPEGIVEKVTRRLGSYSWNLTRDYPLEIVIHEVKEHEVITCSARAHNAFVPCLPTTSRREGAAIAVQPFYSIDAMVLDHNVPCLGFVLKEPYHINIKSSRFKELGYKAGPWIGVFKESILAGRMDDMIEVSSTTGIMRERADDLLDKLVVVTVGQKMAYITDIRASDENLQRIGECAGGADILFIEAYYLARRQQQAFEKAHLTAAQAGMIAKMLHLRKVVPMHISPRYHDRTEKIMGELDAAWLNETSRHTA
jgi:ribonuclease Z